MYEQQSMSFSHLEKALILLRTREQWSRAVAAAVQARYEWELSTNKQLSLSLSLKKYQNSIKFDQKYQMEFLGIK